MYVLRTGPEVAKLLDEFHIHYGLNRVELKLSESFILIVLLSILIEIVAIPVKNRDSIVSLWEKIVQNEFFQISTNNLKTGEIQWRQWRSGVESREAGERGTECGRLWPPCSPLPHMITHEIKLTYPSVLWCIPPLLDLRQSKTKEKFNHLSSTMMLDLACRQNYKQCFAIGRLKNSQQKKNKRFLSINMRREIVTNGTILISYAYYVS